jgi:hypothetical protein
MHLASSAQVAGLGGQVVHRVRVGAQHHLQVEVVVAMTVSTVSAKARAAEQADGADARGLDEPQVLQHVGRRDDLAAQSDSLRDVR